VSALRASVPGNILLLGEYAVLEEGGLGLAMGVEPRVRLDAARSSTLRVEARWPGASGKSPLVDAAARTVSGCLGIPCTGWLRVDSADFFSADGRKSGLGSSAAVTVALVAGLLRLAGRDAASAEAASLAVQAHRLAQGGRGSGYDVLASFHGGAGLVRGGSSPSWEPARFAWGWQLLLFSGPSPVSTADSVARYQEWKERNPGPARDFLQASNAAVRSFSGARSLAEAYPAFDSCRTLGIQLGEAIGVSAQITPPPGLDRGWCKALGAGSELGICLAPGSSLPSGSAVRAVRPSEKGLTWEP
jgi:phosphomevalonate kinase